MFKVGKGKRSIKLSLFVLLILFFSIPYVSALDVTLAWDKLSPSENTVKYRVYFHQEIYDPWMPDPFLEPENLNYFMEYFIEDLEDSAAFGLSNSVAIAILSVEDIPDDQAYYFTVSAFDDNDVESELSETINSRDHLPEEENNPPDPENEGDASGISTGGCFIQSIYGF